MYSKILDHPEAIQAIQPLCLVTGFFQAVLCHYSEFIYSFVGKLNIMIMSPQPKVGDILFLVRFPSASASASA